MLSETQFAQINDEERKLLLLALKVLYHELPKVLLAGFPLNPSDIEALVEKLGGNKQHL